MGYSIAGCLESNFRRCLHGSRREFGDILGHENAGPETDAERLDNTVNKFDVQPSCQRKRLSLGRSFGTLIILVF